MHRFAAFSRRLAAPTILALLLAGCAAAPASMLAADTANAAAMAGVVGADFNGVVLLQSSATATPQIRAFGTANVERGAATTIDTRFQIGSISKWLTSVAVLRLVDRGVLQLDVPIAAWLPQMTASGSTVTLRHLMSNTSGIPNDLSPALKSDPASVMQPMPMAQASMRFVGRAPAFTPGSQFDYVPTNWVIVGAILEKVTGKPFAAVLDDEVLRTAGAASTGVPQAAFDSMPGAARAYGASLPRTPKMSPHVNYVAASGTIYSTAADLARLAHAVYETGLLSPAARAELSRINVPDESYALGGRVLSIALGGTNRMVASESGVSGGYKSLLLYVIGEGKTVVILNNTDMQQSTQAEMAKALLARMYQ
ncbi:MAG: Serine hydrolase [Massilia sp.]|nr:Serine hydrolase [Massilia sp.]